MKNKTSKLSASAKVIIPSMTLLVGLSFSPISNATELSTEDIDITTDNTASNVAPNLITETITEESDKETKEVTTKTKSINEVRVPDVSKVIIETNDLVWTTSDNTPLYSTTDDEADFCISNNIPMERIGIRLDGWNKVIYNGVEYFAEESYLTTEQPSMSVYNRWGIELTDSEIDLLAKILYLECGSLTEPDEGQYAIVEVIFERMISDEFPNTLEGVLSQGSGTSTEQFVTWKNRNIAKPTDREYETINAVLYGEENVLSSGYVYFSRGKQNNKSPIKIGSHWFCKSYNN